MRHMLMFVVLLVGVTLLAFGAGQSEEAGPDEPIQLTMMVSENAEFPVREDWLLFDYARQARPDVEFELQIVPGSDYPTKERLVLSAGTAPEIIVKSDGEVFTQFAAEGALLPVSDYYDQMPHFTQLIEDWALEPDLDRQASADGKLYGLPRINERPLQRIAWAFRDDHLEALSMDAPETLDELYGYLTSVKEMDPDSLGHLNMFNILLGFQMFGPLFGTTGGWGTGGTYGMVYNGDEDIWEFAAITPQYRDMLAYLNRLYEDGLLDPEVFTADNNQVVAKFESGRIASMFHWFPGIKRFSNNLKQNTGGSFSPALPPAGPAGAFVPGVERIEWMHIYPASLADDPDRDEILACFDWLMYSEESQTNASWGREGVTYEVVDGEKRFLDTVMIDGVYDKGIAWTQYGLEGNSIMSRTPWDFRLATFSEADAAYFGALAEQEMVMPLDPSVSLTALETEDANLIGTPIVDYAEEMSVKFIVGTESIEDDWVAFVDEVMSKRADDLIDLYNEAYRRGK